MRKTVLITDDSPAARSILKLFLTPLDLDVVEAESAERALKVLRLMRVDLVIADVNMPGMDGVSFVAATRTDSKTSVRAVPVILLTASLEDGLREAGMRAGASAFLRKPIDSARLVAAAKGILSPRADPVTVLSRPAVAVG